MRKDAQVFSFPKWTAGKRPDPLVGVAFWSAERLRGRGEAGPGAIAEHEALAQYPGRKAAPLGSLGMDAELLGCGGASRGKTARFDEFVF